MKRRTICLSFDFEECDLPREAGVDFPLADGMRVSVECAEAVLDILERQGIKATFFCTLNFAENAPEIMRRLVASGHEIAAHGVDHFRQTAEDPYLCKAGLLQIPASVTPILRFPLFWLALHLLPEFIYHALVRYVLRHDGALVTYFHPWEFSEELARRARELKTPAPVKPKLGLPMRSRLENFIVAMKRIGADFDIINHTFPEESK